MEKFKNQEDVVIEFLNALDLGNNRANKEAIKKRLIQHGFDMVVMLRDENVQLWTFPGSRLLFLIDWLHCFYEVYQRVRINQIDTLDILRSELDQ